MRGATAQVQTLLKRMHDADLIIVEKLDDFSTEVGQVVIWA